jgi:hypothetical protein
MAEFYYDSDADAREGGGGDDAGAFCRAVRLLLTFRPSEAAKQPLTRVFSLAGPGPSGESYFKRAAARRRGQQP